MKLKLLRFPSSILNLGPLIRMQPANPPPKEIKPVDEIEVFNQVKEVMKLCIDVNDLEITLDHSLYKDFKFDSMDILELEMELEDKFDVTVLDFEGLETVRDVVKHISSVLKDKK